MKLFTKKKPKQTIPSIRVSTIDVSSIKSTIQEDELFSARHIRLIKEAFPHASDKLSQICFLIDEYIDNYDVDEKLIKECLTERVKHEI